MKVLITGFDPFDGEDVNPAFEAVQQMNDSIGQIDIIKLELPTVFNQSLELLEKAIQEEEPDIVLCIGQAGGRFDITIEKVAINLNEARIPDNEGQMPLEEVIRVDGDTAYFTNLPIKAMLRDLKANYIPASISYSAGTFVCNHVFYGLMYMINKEFPHIKGGFIHVPFLPEQVIDKHQKPYMSLDMIVKALELMVTSISLNDEDISLRAGETH